MAGKNLCFVIGRYVVVSFVGALKFFFYFNVLQIVSAPSVYTRGLWNFAVLHLFAFESTHRKRSAAVSEFCSFVFYNALASIASSGIIFSAKVELFHLSFPVAASLRKFPSVKYRVSTVSNRRKEIVCASTTICGVKLSVLPAWTVTFLRSAFIS
eukprot:993524_1